MISLQIEKECVNTLLHIFVNFFDNEPNEHLQVWTTLVKTVGIIAMVRRVNVIGVGMMDGVVGKNGLEMDVMAPLVGQINMNVYWIQVKIFFLILEQRIYKNKKQTGIYQNRLDVIKLV